MADVSPVAKSVTGHTSAYALLPCRFGYSPVGTHQRRYGVAREHHTAVFLCLHCPL